MDHSRSCDLERCGYMCMSGGHKACQIYFTMVIGLTLMAHSRSCDLERCGYVRWADAYYTFMYLH